MANGKTDWKFLAVACVSVVSLGVSAYSAWTARRIAQDNFAPKLSITSLQLTATHPEDVMEEQPILLYKIQNQGRLTMRNLHVAEVVTTDKLTAVKRERDRETFEPGDPVDAVTYLTPSLIVPGGFTVDEVAIGKRAFAIQFETESSNDRLGQFRTCDKFKFNHLTGKFERTSECVPQVFK